MKQKINYHQIKAYDGTKIGYQTIGRGKKTIVLCNGLGGSVHAWRPIFEHFGNRFKFISWDYRGLIRSDRPKNLKALTMEDHNRDLDAILKKEKVKTCILMGWSMGVQVALEYTRERSKKVSSLILLNGTAGYPFHTALKNPLLRYILPTLNRLAKNTMPKVAPHLLPLAHRVINRDDFIGLISKLGLIHPEMNVEIFREVAREMLAADLGNYHAIMEHLSRHNAFDLLDKIQVPVLVIAGQRDIITPPSVAHRIAKTIRNSQHFIVPAGSHYSLLEFPDLINLRIQKFLEEMKL